jgi:hypothetical protein
MPFMQQDKRLKIDKDGAPIYGPSGVETEPVGEPYEAVFVQNLETEEVTIQSTKAALQFYTGPSAAGKFRVLNEKSGRRVYKAQKEALGFAAREIGNISELEEDADAPTEEVEETAPKSRKTKAAPVADLVEEDA